MTASFRLDAVDALRALRNRDLTAEALLRSCLARIAEYEPLIEAFVHLDPEAALNQARLQDRTADRTGLCGLPVGLKDIFDTGDMPTTYGSARYAGHHPPQDAEAVRLLRSAGAVFPGKTATTEFAGAAPTATRNPRDPAFSPGGSSSGSAAAVAAGMLPVAIGTQTAGSVIRPAAFCGIVGVKPSFGRIPTLGVRPVAPSFDTVGAFGRTVRDAALLLHWLSRDPTLTADPRQAFTPRIGLCRTAAWHAASSDVQAALDVAASTLARAGATLVACSLPAVFDSLIEAQKTVMAAETYRSTCGALGVGSEGLARVTVAAAIAGAAIPFETEQAARRILEEGRACFAEAIREVDVLLSPSQTDEAPRGLDWTGDPLFNRLWTGLGVPCLTMPCTVGKHGLPIGVQVVAPRGEDARLLAAALWIESALGTRGLKAQRL